MFKSVFKIMAATALFAGVHSLLASRAAKRKAVEVLGGRQRNAFYRPFYNAQSVVTFGALALYASKLPDRELYRVRGAFAWPMRLVQAVSLLYLLAAARQIGFLRFAGAPNLWKGLSGQTSIPPEPEGQGPILDIDGEMKASGPFGTSRHPLNFAMLPVLWLMPRMTLNLAAFNLVTTIYLLVGSLHEEKRLTETYGRAYVDYQQSGVSFFVPRAPRALTAKSNQPLKLTTQ